MNAKILRLNKAGAPVAWLTREETATLIVKEMVIWSMGEAVLEIRGGYNRLGERSVLVLPSIVA
ncbi:MAG: HNH endonuclease, partial [Gammaproteobacteria bacterium]|nr:HNH endonuclease [Gammaproteobacteria bacterium]